MEYKRVDLGDRGAIRAIEDDIQYGEITYTKEGSAQIVVDHTEVEPIAKGKGVGKQLVREMVAFARERKWTIRPLCPFTRAEFEKNLDYRDVLS